MQRGKTQAKSLNRIDNTIRKHHDRDKPSRSKHHRQPNRTPKL